jgi:predicted 3-demethylubiquinone-9 3-methyltransferase (glyoxalase superfamily)
MQKITTFLWFDNQAEEAANFYISVFPNNSMIIRIMPGPEGKAMGVSFQLEGQEFMGLNGGPMFKFTEAISLFVKCETQAEIDEKWEKLTSGGGEESMCGWLKDKYGLSWQIVPPKLGDLLSDKDRAKAQRVMQAMMKMRKINIAELEKAAIG